MTGRLVIFSLALPLNSYWFTGKSSLTAELWRCNKKNQYVFFEKKPQMLLKTVLVLRKSREQ
ncbi:MAG: hypothetical protein C4322_09220 [Mastigocladus sp. ERB_26_1]